MKYTSQLYVSGGYQLPLQEPMPVGTPYAKISDTHINFLLPCPRTGNQWPNSYIDGIWKNDEDDFYDHPPVKEGYIRIYEDHTGRWYTDVLESELVVDETTFEGIFWEEVQKECDLQVIEKIRDARR